MARPSDFGKDQALISLLKANARLPLSDIAKQLGVSRATVQARMRRLEREGAIGGYTIVSGVETGAVELLAAVILMEVEVRRQAGVIHDLKRIPEVVSCHTLSGQFDLLARIHCRTAPELDRVIDAIAQIEGVHRTNSSIMLARKFER